MSDICFEGLKILVMVAVLVLTRYVLPWVKVETWWLSGRIKAVLMAQQTMKATDGKEKNTSLRSF